MENASKALIMAAEILIGVIIISVAVYLFNVMGQYSAEKTSQMEDTQIAQFNQQFLKYYGDITTEENGSQVTGPIKCTIHEIVGLANLAKKVNTENGFSEPQKVTDYENFPNFYIEIDVQIGSKNYTNLEAKSQEELVNLIKENDIASQNGETGIKYFKCAEEPGISNITKRVNYMKFVEI